MTRAAFVGRERELTALAGWLADARAGATRLALCGGEPGVGKTRLAEELALIARAQGVTPVWGRAAEVEGAPPYWLWRQVLRGISEVADVAGIAEQLGVGSDVAMLAPDVFPGVAQRPAADDKGAAERFRMFDSMARLLRTITGACCLVVVLDDVQWADPPSLLLLQHLMRDLMADRLLIVATYRDTDPAFTPVLAELLRQPSTHRIKLTGMSYEDVYHQLVAINGHPVPAELARRVHDLTGGNPFFVGELARDLPQVDTPSSIHTAIAQRVGRLSAQSRELLRVASIVGREFSVAMLAAIVGRPAATCLDPLREAVAAGLVEPAGNDHEYRFVHALTREAIESGMSAEARARLHRAAATAIEQLYAGWILPHLSDLARHWAAAAVNGDQAIAAAWAQQAAGEAMRRLAFEEAVRLYQMAWEVGAREIDDLRRYELLLSLTTARHHCGDHEGTREAATQAATVARRLGRPDLVAEAVLVMECLTSLTWDLALRDTCARALADLGQEHPAIRARLLGRLAETEVRVDDLAAAEKSSRQALAVAEGCGVPDALIAALRARQLVCSGPEGVGDRMQLARRLLRIAHERSSSVIEMSARWWYIDAHFARGDLAAVAAELEQLAWCAGKVGGPVARWFLLRYRAALAQARGDFAAASEHANAAFAAIEATGHPAALPVRLSLQGVVDHHIGGDRHAPGVLAILAAGPGSAATPGHAFRVMDFLGPAFHLAEAGYLDEAAAKFRALGPVETWRTPPYYRLPLYALGVLVGIRIDEAEAVRTLRKLLSAHRGKHVVPGTEVTNYLGPVELYVGKASSYLGELDAAIEDLENVASVAKVVGAAGFFVEAQYELAAALVRRRKPADLPRAKQIVTDCAPAASALGMAPFRVALDRLRPELDGPDRRSPLTARERDVAALVARGLSNRQIAAELYISERTAQTHVQHILTKLRFTSRTQIAVWVSETPRRVDEREIRTPGQ